VVLSISGPILVEADVEHPMHAVLDAPMGARGFGELFGRQTRRGEVIAARSADLAVAFDLGFDAGDGGERGHGGAIRVGFGGKEPVDVMDDGVATGLDAAVIGVDGLAMVGDRGPGVGEIGLDVGEGGGPVGFQGEEIVAAAIEDGLGGLGVAMDRVGGHERPFEVEQFQKIPRRRDLVAAFGHRLLPDDEARLGRKRRHHMQRRGPRGPVEGSPQRLAVDRHHAGSVGAQRLQKTAKTARQRLRIDEAEQPRECVMARQPIRKT